jgi:hypothetical protein
MSERIHYEVETELNPRFLETGNLSDYYGVYYVVKYSGYWPVARVQSFENGNGRELAYALARELQNEQDATPPAGDE